VSKVQTALKQLVSSENQNLGAKALAEAAAKVEGVHAARERQSTVEAMAQNDREGLAKTGRRV
jgi:hypothetical protein